MTTTRSERSGRRELNKAENRAALLKAARTVFADIGYGAAGVRDIVRRTDLASGTFYNYFKDKDEIFEAVVREMSVELMRRGDGQGELIVADDGVGYDPDKPAKGIGQRLIRALTEQIGGTSEMTTGHGGSRFTLVFPLSR